MVRMSVSRLMLRIPIAFLTFTALSSAYTLILGIGGNSKFKVPITHPPRVALKNITTISIGELEQVSLGIRGHKVPDIAAIEPALRKQTESLKPGSDQDEEVITNALIVKMVTNKIGEKAILDMINQARKCDFKVGASSIIKLKAAGFSDVAINAM